MVKLRQFHVQLSFVVNSNELHSNKARTNLFLFCNVDSLHFPLLPLLCDCYQKQKRIKNKIQFKTPEHHNMQINSTDASICNVVVLFLCTYSHYYYIFFVSSLILLPASDVYVGFLHATFDYLEIARLQNAVHT